MYEVFKPIFEESLQKKKGVTFYVNGNVIVGYVTSIINTKVVEAKNQKSDRILIWIDKIDAIEM